MQIIKEFAEKHSREWKFIFAAAEHTEATRKKILEALDPFYPLITSDSDMVVFGSIARKECTSGSYVDWTLLIDGPVGPHYKSAEVIGSALKKAKLAEPGSSGMFGSITFSHELVHYIGGQGDTNHNISRRILLLLEAEKIPLNEDFGQSGTAFSRVIGQVVREYVRHDSSLGCHTDKTSKVPRFLLNDIIRFWRTICVDFAYKQKEQPNGKWGLRNIKLRLSRKLIYIKGLMMCYSCYLNSEPGEDAVEEHLLQVIPLSPLEILLKVMSNRGVDGLLLRIVEAYNGFLGMMDDKATRDKLAELSPLNAYSDTTFEAARKVAHEFQDAFMELFEADEDLRKFSNKYVIF